MDCGEGVSEQLIQAGIDLRHVHEIVLTHHHFDHIGSLFALLGRNMMLQRHVPLNIYGPPGTRPIVDGLIAACDVPCEIGFGAPGQTLPHPRDFVVVREITPGDVLDIDGIRVSCCENTHYRDEDQFGQDGPLSLSLRFDAPDRSIVFTGDTGPCRNLESFAKGAQLLVGEMIDVDYIMEQIRKKNPDMSQERIGMMRRHMLEHHLDPEQLGELATRAGVDHVVAVHLPFGAVGEEVVQRYEARISATFAGDVTVAGDLDRF